MFGVYEVRKQDTVDSIAKMYFTDVNTLKRINGFGDDKELTTGELIVIPKNKIFDIYKPKSTESIYEISKKIKVDVNSLALINGIESRDIVYPDQEILIPNEKINFYITKDGDTINTLKKYFKINGYELLELCCNVLILPNQFVAFKKEK